MLLKKRIPLGFLFNKVKWELPVIALYAFGITFLDEYLEIDNIAVPLAIPGIIGTAISLILAFRTNQAYERWWEARKLWGSIVNDSRTLVRQIKVSAGNQESLQLIQRVANRQIAWCFALGRSLRREDVLTGMDTYLSDHEIRRIMKHKNIPNALLEEHSKDIVQARKEGLIDDFQYLQLDRTVRRLTDWMGASERIKNTVFPATYSYFVSFLLYTFVILLPLGIVEYSGWLEPLVVIAVTVPFFLLERSAMNMQDPFEGQPTDTAVTTIACTIEQNIKEMLEEEHVKTSPGEFDFYQL